MWKIWLREHFFSNRHFLLQFFLKQIVFASFLLARLAEFVHHGSLHLSSFCVPPALARVTPVKRVPVGGRAGVSLGGVPAVSRRRPREPPNMLPRQTGDGSPAAGGSDGLFLALRTALL